MATVGRIVHARDFQAILGTTARARSEHFALHYLADVPVREHAAHSAQVAEQHKLSTISTSAGSAVVDRQARHDPKLGLVVPKRHARRAVTRTLLKRQMRAAMQRHAAGMVGWWVVRLRSGFPVADFRSAASEPLRRAASAELDTLFAAGRRKVGLDPVAAEAAIDVGRALAGAALQAT